MANNKEYSTSEWLEYKEYEIHNNDIVPMTMDEFFEARYRNSEVPASSEDSSKSNQQ